MCEFKSNADASFSKVGLSNKNVYQDAVSLVVLTACILKDFFYVRLIRSVHFETDAAKALRHYVIISELKKI